MNIEKKIKSIDEELELLWDELDKLGFAVKKISNKLDKIHFIENKVLDSLKKNPNLSF